MRNSVKNQKGVVVIEFIGIIVVLLILLMVTHQFLTLLRFEQQLQRLCDSVSAVLVNQAPYTDDIPMDIKPYHQWLQRHSTTLVADGISMSVNYTHLQNPKLNWQQNVGAQCNDKPSTLTLKKGEFYRVSLCYVPKKELFSSSFLSSVFDEYSLKVFNTMERQY